MINYFKLNLSLLFACIALFLLLKPPKTLRGLEVMPIIWRGGKALEYRTAMLVQVFIGGLMGVNRNVIGKGRDDAVRCKRQIENTTRNRIESSKTTCRVSLWNTALFGFGSLARDAGWHI